ncbi:beta galactosidase jelly roll domain-containing protein [Carboxylicivirga sp. A043]|uniref:beta galactosidase jelly roll domain-containing protein n=1 Tax=Carboxylicivirga litoralis TaxID=2816963 RepID=UPI0021CAE9A4|nr:beta galactosidase jelly roll domain-containing protein [Carboxylicivirga sp. A043]MCU4155043.1 beta galactosidase jelly roll domain-containing protein [Carboxylicivirga sp. A043]
MIAKTLKYFALITILLLAGSALVNSQILQEEQYLEGNWKFSIGDNEQWKNPDFDDSQWQHIRVPASWESQGYNDYNGFAWYRKTIRLDIIPDHDLILRLGNIDDADEVFVNGKLVGKSGGMPPNTQTAYDKQRQYTVPSAYWRSGKNVIAIRVYDFYNNGGILSGPVSLNTNLTNKLLSINLAGTWKFAVHNHKDAEKSHYDDSNWSNINVPAFWESEGWDGFDGVAWYRTSFILPRKLQNEELILLLGKIDDEDKTYVNGTRIGGVSPGATRSSLARGINGSYQAYTTIRAYKIPNSVVTTNGKNTIAVRVVDSGIDGGIYEGPVGIMTREQFERFKKLVKKEPNYMDQFWEWLNN